MTAGPPLSTAPFQVALLVLKDESSAEKYSAALRTSEVDPSCGAREALHDTHVWGQSCLDRATAS